MEIIQLPWGEQAPEESYCISGEEVDDGRWTLNTSAVQSCAMAEDGVSDATIGSAPYDSYDAAEAAGLAIAAEHCVERVYVSKHRANTG